MTVILKRSHELTSVNSFGMKHEKSADVQFYRYGIFIWACFSNFDEVPPVWLSCLFRFCEYMKTQHHYFAKILKLAKLRPNLVSFNVLIYHMHKRSLLSVTWWKNYNSIVQKALAFSCSTSLLNRLLTVWIFPHDVLYQFYSSYFHVF